MEIDLTSPRFRALFCLIVILLVGILVFAAGRVWLAEHWNASSRPRLWLKAAKLEPDNAGYWEHLGLYKQWDLVNGDPRQAVRYLERATQINPRSDRAWMELASADEALGDRTGARQAYEKAQADHPISSDVAWRYGSFLLRQGVFVAGFAEIRRALVTDPTLATSAISECWQASPNIGAILDEALPAKSDYYLTAINFLLSQKQFEAALAVWNRLLTLKQPITMAQAIPLVDALMDQNRMDEADQIWQQALEATNWPHNRNEKGQLVFNSGFEHGLVNGGFGWRELPVSGARFSFDSRVRHSGTRSLRIDFDGSANLDFQHVLQYVPVQSKTRYRFSAYVRTEKISTDSGIRFAIYDPRHPAKVQVLTPTMVGTNPWAPVNTGIVTAADTDLLVIALRRIPSWKFDNKLAGTVWVDDVSLVPVEQVSKGNAR
jgi:type IV pilus assembly protein PilF